MRSSRSSAALTFIINAAITLTSFLLVPLPGNAHITRIEITSIQSPAFEGRIFGAAGAYEKLRGKAYGEVDPRDVHNAGITDILLAPRNSRGNVEYSMDIYILKPINLEKGNHKLFLEVNNRGGKLFGGFNNSSGGNDPTSASDAGDAFLMNLGYTIAWNGWDISAASTNDNLTITVPVAKNKDGSPISGPSYEYIVFDNAVSADYTLAYPALSLNKEAARLTVRKKLSDEPLQIPANGWEFINDHKIRLLPSGKTFEQSSIYEFTYTAKNPLVAGLGLAATRDFVSFMRYGKADVFGYTRPLTQDVKYSFAFAVSQPARYLNDFRTLGFNSDEQGRRVLDGIENWLGGASGVGINFRFAQPGRTERNRQNHLYPEALFPFAFPVLTDPFTGKRSGRLQRCSADNTCPMSLEINSSNEYWVKAASLLHTDLAGNDLPDPVNVRFYLVAGTQHGAANPGNRGVCQQLQNSTRAEPALRALFIALDKWVTNGIEPPASQVPRRSDHTAAAAIPRAGSATGTIPPEELGWPSIPGVTYNGIVTTRFQLDFGKSLEQGIVAKYPPSLTGRPVYPSFVSRVDVDGNEIAGIRLPPVAAPTGTLTGWALRRSGYAENEGCEAAGQYIPFLSTKEERMDAKDTRLSLKERYPNHDSYIDAVRNCAEDLMAKRLLLDEDFRKYVKEAEDSYVGR